MSSQSYIATTVNIITIHMQSHQWYSYGTMRHTSVVKQSTYYEHNQVVDV